MSFPKSLRSAIYPPLCAILIAHAGINAGSRSLPEGVLTGCINGIDWMGDNALLRRDGRLNMLEIGVLYLYPKCLVGYTPRSKQRCYLPGRTGIIDTWPPLIRGNFFASIVHLRPPCRISGKFAARISPCCGVIKRGCSLKSCSQELIRTGIVGQYNQSKGQDEQVSECSINCFHF